MKFELIGPVVLEEKMFWNVDGRTENRVNGTQLAHQWASSSAQVS